MKQKNTDSVNKELSTKQSVIISSGNTNKELYIELFINCFSNELEIIILSPIKTDKLANKDENRTKLKLHKTSDTKENE